MHGKPLKVIYLTNGLPHYYNLVLNRLNRQPDVDLLVVIPRDATTNVGEGVYQTTAGVEFEICRLAEYARLRLYSSFKGLAALLWKQRPDVIVTSEIHLLGFFLNLPLAVSVKLLGAKVILQSIPFRLPTYEAAKKRCSEPSPFVDRLPYLLRWLMRNLGLGFGLRLLVVVLRKHAYTHVQAHLNYVEDAIDIFGSYGVPKDRIFFTYNSPDTDTYRDIETSIEGSPQILPKCSRRLVHVGRLVEWKRVDLLLLSFARILHKFPDAELLVIGTGPQEQELRTLAETLKVTDSVRFVGGVYDPALLGRYLRSSNIYVLAGMGGLSINDAMFHRLPVICSVCDGTEKKLVRPGLNGNFFREGDEDDLVEKLIELLDDPAKCEVMGKNSRQIIDSEINVHTVIAGFRSAFKYVVSH